MRISGILIDLWHRSSRDGAPGAYLLWVRTEGGVACLEDRDFRPSFAVIPEKNAVLVEQAVAQHENVSRAETVLRFPSLYADEQVPVIRAFMVDERRAKETMLEIRQRAPAPVRFAESKIRADLQWHYLRNIAPHTVVNAEACGSVLKHIECAGPCRPSHMQVLAVDPVFSSDDPRKCRLLSMSLFDGASEHLLQGTEEEIMQSFQSHLDATDPDVLALFDADSEKLPLMGLRAGENGIGLRLGRISWPTRLYESRLSAERISHWRSPQVRAPGRVIMDLWKDARTDADLKRTDMRLDSIYGNEFGNSGSPSEAAMIYRLARERLPMFTSWCERCMMPLDSVTREKHGFMNASMVNAARILTTVIPEEAEYPEGFKTPLVESVKENGGLVITPEAGLHEDVAILDFSSLFPRIFVKHNISPETINCRHAECIEKGERVPFLGFHICTKRKGVYPEVFGKVLEERDRIKKEMKALDPSCERYRELEVLSRSLKMQLVSPYGYMQFALNNFRTVDGNRSVPAFGRWYLLKARDMAEEAGFGVIYADTDSLFVQRSGAKKEDFQRLADQINSAFDMDLKLENVCRWVLFLPERQGCTKGLKKKYFASVDGKPLARGLEVRRQDRARIAKMTQEHVLEMLALAHNEGEFKTMIPSVAAYVRGQAARISEGRISADDLVIVRKLSQRPEEYKAPVHHAVAAELLADSGRSVRVGGKIEYIVTGRNKAVPRELTGDKTDYDVESYVDNTVRPIYMLLREFGLEYEDLLPGPRQTTLRRYEKYVVCKA
jgi:DNA polymerase elongation subunit (family B)